jgi:hypothetical protein
MNALNGCHPKNCGEIGRTLGEHWAKIGRKLGAKNCGDMNAVNGCHPKKLKNE